MICKWKRVVGLQDWPPAGVLRQPAQRGGHRVRVKQDRWGTGLTVALAGSCWGLMLSVTGVKLPSCSVRRNLRLRMLRGCCLTLCGVLHTRGKFTSAIETSHGQVGRSPWLNCVLEHPFSFSLVASYCLLLPPVASQVSVSLLSVSHFIVSDSLRPYGLQPCRLLCPWLFPGRNTGIGFHVLSRGSSQPRGEPESLASSALAGRFITTQPPGKPFSQQRTAV